MGRSTCTAQQYVSCHARGAPHQPSMRILDKRGRPLVPTPITLEGGAALVAATVRGFGRRTRCTHTSPAGSASKSRHKKHVLEAGREHLGGIHPRVRSIVSTLGSLPADTPTRRHPEASGHPSIGNQSAHDGRDGAPDGSLTPPNTMFQPLFLPGMSWLTITSGREGRIDASRHQTAPQDNALPTSRPLAPSPTPTRASKERKPVHQWDQQEPSRHHGRARAP